MPARTLARWYLIQTKPHQDARAEEHLRRQCFECFRPLRSQSPSLPGQKPRAEESLFPGYLFIRLDQRQDNWYPIRSTRGVSRIVSFGGQPVPVQDALIERLRERLAQDEPRQAPPFNPGDRVRLRQDAFTTVEAIFVCNDGDERSVILLNLLQREHRVSVRTREIDPCL